MIWNGFENVLCQTQMLLAVLLLLLLAGISCICPPECECELDIRGRRLVTCSRGGMQVPIPITQMDAMLEVLKISAPDRNQNILTIGPIFQQFTRLEEVHIIKSNIPAIGKHSFWGVPNLKILNLTQNNISQVLEYNFQVIAIPHNKYIQNITIDYLRPPLLILNLSLKNSSNEHKQNIQSCTTERFTTQNIIQN